jgi:hypothetical protein
VRYFTYYWNSEQYELLAESINAGQAGWCDYTGGSGFRQRGVGPGDTLYILNWGDGYLSIFGRMVVDRVLDHAEAQAELGDVYEAPEHVLARQHSSTPLVLDAIAGDDPGLTFLDDLSFLQSDGSVSPPKRGPSGAIEPQTFRNVREITADTAAVFDGLLGFEPVDGILNADLIVRQRMLSFLIRDDSGDELELGIDVVSKGRVVGDREVFLEVSVPGDVATTPVSMLATLLWDRAQANATEAGLALAADRSRFEELVEQAMIDDGHCASDIWVPNDPSDPPPPSHTGTPGAVLQITLGDWVHEANEELGREGRGYRPDIPADELVRVNRGRWRTKAAKAAAVKEVLFVHRQEVVAVARVTGPVDVLSDGRIAWRSLQAIVDDPRLGEPADRSYGNPLRYL